MRATPASVDEFFAGHEVSRGLYEAVAFAIATAGGAEVRVSTSQIAFRRRRNLAMVWMPDAYLGSGHAPLVLTVLLRRRDPSSRWKQVVEPYPGRFTHHLELYAVAGVDEQVVRWLREAWETAGPAS